MAGNAYEISAQWYADIIDQCAGKCGWLEASLLKTGADGLGNLVYGALGAGSLPKPGKEVEPQSSNASKIPGYVDEPPFNPGGTGSAAKPWSTKGRIKYVELPTEGKIRFVPDSNYSSTNPLPRGPNNGYLDKFGNEWVKGPSRTVGQAFEWDVQLSPKGKAQLGWATRDGSHLNVSLDGRITHK
ncbi:polymorphic toxin type 17 domain-containing protein [Erwinia sp. INIA-01]|nr:polymorphic toxin type 17 domain-containing protein [Erwinia sp. S43]MCW1877827.1 polymorphic toxin type 17 domain-containing protein [Erwinia sp. INIA01]